MLIRLLVGHDIIHTQNLYTPSDVPVQQRFHTGDQWYIANHALTLEPTDDLQIVDVVKGTTTYCYKGGWHTNAHKLFTSY